MTEFVKAIKASFDAAIILAVVMVLLVVLAAVAFWLL